MSLLPGTTTGNRISVGTLGSWNPLKLSLAAWVNPVTLASIDGLFGKADPNTPYSAFQVNLRISSGNADVRVKRGGGGNTTNLNYDFTNTFTTGAWQMIGVSMDTSLGAGAKAAVYRATLTTPPVALTIDDAGGGGAHTEGANYDSLASISAAWGNAADAATANGQMDAHLARAVIWDNVFFTATDWLKFWMGGVKSCTTRPRGYWEMGFDGTGTQRDFSGNGYNGTVTGATLTAHAPLPPIFGYDRPVSILVQVVPDTPITPGSTIAIY